jgi:hypothetical protein
VEKEIKKGDLCFIKYLDAAYSYDLNNLKKETVLPTVFSLGVICDNNAHFINVGLVMEDGNNEPIEGLIIPKKAVLNIKPLKV